MMAKAVGVSVSSVQRIWRVHGLQPHRVRLFKLSKNPEFTAKLHDVVGCMSTLRRTPSCSALTRRANFKRSTAHSPVYRSRRGAPGQDAPL
jgi:hypothetical protein